MRGRGDRCVGTGARRQERRYAAQEGPPTAERAEAKLDRGHAGLPQPKKRLRLAVRPYARLGARWTGHPVPVSPFCPLPVR